MSEAPLEVTVSVQTTFVPETCGNVCVLAAVPVESCVIVPVTAAACDDTPTANASAANWVTRPRITRSYDPTRALHPKSFGLSIV